MEKRNLSPILALSCLIMAIWSSGKSLLGMLAKIVYTAGCRDIYPVVFKGTLV